MNFKLLTIFGLAAIVFTGCNKDEINDLEKRLDKVENSLGTNEPIKMEFSTKTGQGEDIIKNTAFLFKSAGYDNFIEDNQDGTFDVYVERFSDVEWYEGAWIDFTYNPTTKEVTNPTMRPYFYDKYGVWINPLFSPNTAGNSITINVKSFDGVSGKIDLTVTASTTADAPNNEYAGKSMSCSLSFKGKLNVYID
jgi:hypothetical protein